MTFDIYCVCQWMDTVSQICFALIIYVPLILIGIPMRECSQFESLMESIFGPQFATRGMTSDSSNMISVRQLVAF